MSQAGDSSIGKPDLAHLRTVVAGNIESHDQLTNLASKTANRQLLAVLLEIARQRRCFAEQLQKVINGDASRNGDGEQPRTTAVKSIDGDGQLFAGEIAFALLADLESCERRLLDSYAAALEEVRQEQARELLVQQRQQVAAALAVISGLRRRRW